MCRRHSWIDMIPELPETVTLEERLDFYNQLVARLTDQSTVHVHWHTHKGNPSVCWICDLVILSTKILDDVDRYLSKSTVDNETDEEHDSESEPEIEDNLNYDEEPPLDDVMETE